jgi:hypothetical protein
MAIKERMDRMTDFENELAQVLDRTAGDTNAEGILGTLEDLRRLGVGRSHYNLESPYGQGMARCMDNEDGQGDQEM